MVFADGVGPGRKQTVDGVLPVLLLLPHHGSVLPTCHACILRRVAAAIFGYTAIGGEKVFPTVPALAGGMGMMQAVH